MSTLEQLLGIDVTDPKVQLAAALAEQDYLLIRELIAIRSEKRISQDAVGKAMGVTQATVAAFERLDNDPKLSTIRRYAIAVGALIAHSVEKDEGQLADGARLDARSVFIPNAYVAKRATVKSSGERMVLANVKRTDFAMAA
ncbi:helix-turn-helix domain-containing protein [Leucobacter sp.]